MNHLIRTGQLDRDLAAAATERTRRPAGLAKVAAITPLIEARYAFPAEAGAESRGVPTAHSAGALAAEFGASDPFVWPSIDGRIRGASVAPLYAAAPATAVRNPALYELLTLVDAVRLGRARERARAKQLLRERIMPVLSAEATA